MTSLAHQLKRLALPQSDPALLTRREVASLLFSPADAAAMDRSTFYALGCTGLEELLGIEPSFQEFQDILFSRASLSLERSVQSKDVNRRLDAAVSLFLSRLCPYFLLKPAHKCIEWLVHRFHIQLYNADSLLACVFPYHDTNVFARVLQLLNIRDNTHRWNWLRSVQKAGVPLSRAALITHCYTDLSFMDFICTMVTDAVQAYSGHSGSCPQLRVVFSFYASTIVSALDAVDKVSDAIVSKLLPYIQKGLKSSLLDYTASSYMLVSQLAVKAVLEDGLVDSLSVHVSRALLREPLLSQEGLGCLLVLLQTQRDGAVGSRALARLSSVPSLVSSLQLMAASHDVGPLLRVLLPHLLDAVFTCGSETEQLTVLLSVLQSVPLTGGLDRTLARLLLDGYLRQTDLSPEHMDAFDRRLQPAVRLFESRYCGALDGILAGHVIDVSGGGEQKRLFHRFLSLSVSSGKHQLLVDSDTSLFLSLTHPQPSVRVSAVEHLMGVVTSGQQQSVDEAFLRDAVMERLKDDVPEVAAAALRVLEVLLDVLDPEDTVSSLLSLLLRLDLSHTDTWLSVQMEAVRLLSDSRLLKGDDERLQRAGWRLLPLLVVSSASSSQLTFTSCLARSSIFCQNPLTHNWTEELDEVMKRSSQHDFVGLVNERLVSTVTKNLSNMEHFTRRDTLEKLCVCVEQQCGSSLRCRTSLLVLTRVLLLGLVELSGTQHLLTAQRAFTVLEAPLTAAIRTATAAEEVDGGPASFCDALTAFLLGGERRSADACFSSALLALLRDFICSLQCHDASFTVELWWNPEKLDTNTCCYLGLLCRLFAVIMSGAAEGPAAASFRALMKLLVQVHLHEPLLLFRFLCLLWGYGGNHGDQLDVKVGAVLQTQALYMGGALLSAQPAAALRQLLAADSPVVPSLLCCLTSPLREVRRAALSALQSLSAAGASPFQPITERLLKTSEEIIADPTYLSQALASLHVEQSRSVQTAMDQLLQSVQTTSCPSYSAGVLLTALSQVNGPDVLSRLLPVLDRLLEQSGPDTPAPLPDEARLLHLILGKFNQDSAPLLARDHTCLNLFIRALRNPNQPHQITALQQITKAFFSAVGDAAVQQKLLSVMFDVLEESRSPLVANTVSSVFKGLAVDAQLVANELAPPDRPPASATVQQSRRSRASHRRPQGGADTGPQGGADTGPQGGADTGPQGGADTGPQGGAVSWHRVTLILELLQHKKKLKKAQVLLPALFSLLARSLESSPSDPDSLEYSKQLLLSCLLNVCTKLSPEGGAVGPDVLDEQRFSVELVVQVIRTSDVPQTHHHALLLLGAAAAIFPEKVLHNIMPIFTFMGANILRLDDVYSFRVIEQTLQTVIPALVQAHRLPDGSSSSRLVAVVTRIVHVFADALPHVPDHRRLPVLSQLVTTLGPAHFLWVLMLLLFKQHATQSATGEKDVAVDRDVPLWISLCCSFSVNDQLTSLVSVLTFLLQLPDDSADAAVKRSAGRRGASQQEEVEEVEEVEELIFSVEAHSSKELRHFKFLCVSFMAQLLGSASFIGKVADEEDSVDESLQQRLLEELLRFIHRVARCVETNADKPTAKFWRVLLNKAYDVLDKVNSLLPTDTFIAVMRGLMGNEVASVRRKAMELLNNRLQQRPQWDEQQVAALLQLTADLLSIVGKSPARVTEAEQEAGREAEQAVNRQTALYSLKLLCRSFGSAHQEAFVPVLRRAVDIVTATDEDKNVTGSALLCIAEAVGTLKALAIPQLPRLMPAVLRSLSDRKEVLTNDIYLLSAVSALQRVTETLPLFISPYLQDATAQLCQLTRLLGSASSSSSSSQLAARLSALRTTLSTQLPPRVLLPTVCRCYSSMVQDRKDQLGALMSVLKEHIGHMDKEQLSVHQSELTAFFLTALDFRAQHCQGDLTKTAEIEGSVIDCLVAMVMKMSEVTFRPLFFKLLDWSKTVSKERLLTFYRLVDFIADRLKGLFVMFAGNLVKPFTDLLRQTHTGERVLDGEQKVVLLLHFVLAALHKIFLYDTHRFLSRERAEALMGPLLDQLENTTGGEQVYQQRVSQLLVPCVGQFCVALADDSLWKNLNQQVLLRTRNQDSRVRLSALLVLMELASQLKENYVVLLPETIPFLAELMEDECEEVEQQVQKVVQEMENILGEPLQSYF